MVPYTAGCRACITTPGCKIRNCACVYINSIAAAAWTMTKAPLLDSILFHCCAQVRDVREMRGSKPMAKAAKAKAVPAEPELDFDDEDDYEGQVHDQVRPAGWLLTFMHSKPLLGWGLGGWHRSLCQGRIAQLWCAGYLSS